MKLFPSPTMTKTLALTSNETIESLDYVGIFFLSKLVLTLILK